MILLTFLRISPLSARRELTALREAFTMHYKEMKETGNPTVIEVVAALIEDGNKILICQRPAHKARGMLWEFVGGKVEPGETKAQALARECKEELGVTVAVGDAFMSVVHAYPDLTVNLTLLRAAIAEGAPQKLEHSDIRWVTPRELDDYPFCPADQAFIERLKAAI